LPIDSGGGRKEEELNEGNQKLSFPRFRYSIGMGFVVWVEL
jgi:hypothetical protein